MGGISNFPRRRGGLVGRGASGGYRREVWSTARPRHAAGVERIDAGSVWPYSIVLFGLGLMGVCRARIGHGQARLFVRDAQEV